MRRAWALAGFVEPVEKKHAKRPDPRTDPPRNYGEEAARDEWLNRLSRKARNRNPR